MLMLLNLMLQRAARDERGVVSVEWIILGTVVMVAIVAAFGPAFGNMLTAAVTGIGNTLSAQVTAAGS
jgi:Flp pilus assembly pilin Flp